VIKTTRGEQGTTVLQSVCVVLDKDTLTLDALEQAIRQDARSDARDPKFREFIRQAAVVQLYAMIFNAGVTPPSQTTVTRNAQTNAERQLRWRDSQKAKASPLRITPPAVVEPPEPLPVTPAADQDASAEPQASEPQNVPVTQDTEQPTEQSGAMSPADFLALPEVDPTPPSPVVLTPPSPDVLPDHVKRRLADMRASFAEVPAPAEGPADEVLEEPAKMQRQTSSIRETSSVTLWR